MPPKEAWIKAVETACSTFEKIVFPITASTKGLGQLIEIKFQQLNEAQKVSFSKTLEEANSKLRMTGKPTEVPKVSVIYEAMNSADQQVDEVVRSLWANILAKELGEGSVHPEIAKLLVKLTPDDVALLMKVRDKQEKNIPVLMLKITLSRFTIDFAQKQRTYNHIHLKNLNLISQVENLWRVVFPKYFAQQVS